MDDKRLRVNPDAESGAGRYLFFEARGGFITQIATYGEHETLDTPRDWERERDRRNRVRHPRGTSLERTFGGVSLRWWRVKIPPANVFSYPRAIGLVGLSPIWDVQMISKQKGFTWPSPDPEGCPKGISHEKEKVVIPGVGFLFFFFLMV